MFNGDKSQSMRTILHNEKQNIALNMRDHHGLGF